MITYECKSDTYFYSFRNFPQYHAQMLFHDVNTNKENKYMNFKSV